MNKVSNLTSSNAISTCMSDESAHGYVFNRTLVQYVLARVHIYFSIGTHTHAVLYKLTSCFKLEQSKHDA